MEPILSLHITRNGRTLTLYDWMLQPGLAVRGVVLLVHRLGEHMGR